jgi:glycosyltransferase involved in cell wall biosynthesis
MHVTLVSTTNDACAKFRLLWPERAVRDSPGLETVVVEGIPERPETDVIVIQRPLWRKNVDAIARLQELGIAVVVDLDDDFSELHPDHPSHRQLDADTNARELTRACAAADLVTAPAPQLLERYAPHGRGELIRNYLPEWTIEFAARGDGRTVGWSGVAADHPGDLEDTRGAVAAALRDREARFQVVGPPEGVGERLGLAPPVPGTGMLPIRDYFAALAGIDVGIVPLGRTAFNAGKSALKGLEWAVAGVPFVASPAPEYEWLAAQGVGTIARNPQEWEEQLGKLLDDEALRRERAEAGRRLAAERFLLGDNAWRWPRAWQRALRNRRASG